MPEFPLLPEVSAPVREDVDRYRDEFVAAKPFRHVMVESFFEPGFAEELLAMPEAIRRVARWLRGDGSRPLAIDPVA